MQIGMVGLGRMGANMARRLMRDGHNLVVFDLNPENVSALVAEGAAGANSLGDFIDKLSQPRIAWVMVPAGGPTENTVNALSEVMSKDDIIIDGGNSYYKDDVRRAQRLKDKGLHFFQLITLTAMEPPISFDANAVRDEQVKILKAIQPLSDERVLKDAIRGQYGEGKAAKQKMAAYRDEPKVDPQSNTPTFVAMKLFIDDWRWSGVPFYLRTGKRLARRATEIAIRFKRARFSLFRHTPVDHLNPNWLVMRLQPDEGISLSFGAKIPGAVMRLGNVDMEFCYKDYFGSEPQTGYERLLYECMLGDATLFQRADMVEASWNVVAPIQAAWNATKATNFPNYAAGSWGPAEADELLARDGHHWRNCE